MVSRTKSKKVRSTRKSNPAVRAFKRGPRTTVGRLSKRSVIQKRRKSTVSSRVKRTSVKGKPRKSVASRKPTVRVSAKAKPTKRRIRSKIAAPIPENETAEVVLLTGSHSPVRKRVAKTSSKPLAKTTRSRRERDGSVVFLPSRARKDPFKKIKVSSKKMGDLSRVSVKSSKGKPKPKVSGLKKPVVPGKHRVAKSRTAVSRVLQKCKSSKSVSSPKAKRTQQMPEGPLIEIAPQVDHMEAESASGPKRKERFAKKHSKVVRKPSKPKS